MFERSGLTLHCINYNYRLVVTSHKELILENSAKPANGSALWMINYLPPSWMLVNQVSAMCLTFDVEKNLIKSLKENEPIWNESLQVKDGDRHLLLRLSTTAALNNKFGLELYTEKHCHSPASILFFAYERSDRIFRDIDLNCFNNSLTSSKISPDLSDEIYDYVVIGSSFCSLAFISRILQNDPKAKILVLERGRKHLSKHHQHCLQSSPAEVEFRSWAVSDETTRTEFVTDVHGQIPLLGGRSTYWSGWSPTPSAKELVGWPEDLRNPLKQIYFDLAHDFLGVVTADKIDAYVNNNILYGAFQTCPKRCLDSTASIESVEQVVHAPLAMGNKCSMKFCTVDMLLSMTNVTVIFDCVVKKVLHDGKKATAVQTSQGPILLSHSSKLIMAMSTLPATTLVLNSFKNTDFPLLSNVGKRFTAHFVSSVIARIPRQCLIHGDNSPEIELGAVYIAGNKDDAQYHLQISAMSYTSCENDIEIYNICKKYSANSISRECIDLSRNFIVVSCSTLGELDYKNKNNQFNLTTNDQCLSTNGELKFQLNDQDKTLWDWMDNITFKAMNQLSRSANNDDLEYWHETDKSWKRNTPPSEQMRKKCFVHDASTMWIGDRDDIEAPVGLDYRLRGVDNVYITGGALWPTGGSWNPVLTIVAMALQLADTISETSRHRAEK